MNITWTHDREPPNNKFRTFGTGTATVYARFKPDPQPPRKIDQLGGFGFRKERPHDQ